MAPPPQQKTAHEHMSTTHVGWIVESVEQAVHEHGELVWLPEEVGDVFGIVHDDRSSLATGGRGPPQDEQ
jgi:hypothetical protein